MLNWWKYAEYKFKSFFIANIFWITSLEICIYILTYLLFTKRLVLAISNQYCVAYFLFFIECISICFNEVFFVTRKWYSMLMLLSCRINKKINHRVTCIILLRKKIEITLSTFACYKKDIMVNNHKFKAQQKNCRW